LSRDRQFQVWPSPRVGRNWARVDLIYSWAADQKPDIRLLALGNV